MNVNATVFVPKEDAKVQEKPKADDKKEPQKKVEDAKPVQNPIKKEGSFDFGGYKNPYQATIDIEKEKKKQLDKELEEEKSKTYSIDFIMSMREDNKLRPANMAFLILPHKKRTVNLPKNPSQVSPEQEEFQKRVGKLRSVLNKISNDNFERLERQILNEFDYNPSLLQELMK